jgi:hypothetical protein
VNNMAKWTISQKEAVGRNTSKFGGRKQSYEAHMETKSGKRTIVGVYPVKDEALKMYQTLRIELREQTKRNHGTVLRLVQTMKTSTNPNMSWTEEHRTVLKEVPIKPYSKIYSSRMKKIRGY